MHVVIAMTGEPSSFIPVETASTAKP